MPPKSGNKFLICFKRGSVILYKKLPIILTILLFVFITPKVISQLNIAWRIRSQINISIIWLIKITIDVIIILYKKKCNLIEVFEVAKKINFFATS